MPPERSTTFLVLGLACILGGVIALVGGALPLGTIARWGGPLLLLAAGATGVARWWPRPRRRSGG